jgi:hypothetical protein
VVELSPDQLERYDSYRCSNGGIMGDSGRPRTWTTPLVATAVAHAHLRAAQDAVDHARIDADHTAHARAAERDLHGEQENRRGRDEYDPQDSAWRRSLADHTRRRIHEAAGHCAGWQGPAPPF